MKNPYCIWYLDVFNAAEFDDYLDTKRSLIECNREKESIAQAKQLYIETCNIENEDC